MSNWIATKHHFQLLSHKKVTRHITSHYIIFITACVQLSASSTNASA